MFKKIKQINPRSMYKYLALLRDVRILGLLVFGIISVLVTWSGVQAVQDNYILQQQIVRLEEENKIQALENANLALKNKYYETDQYQELEARRLFGLAAPGEVVYKVPESVALSLTTDITKDTPEQIKVVPEKPKYQQNLEAWVDFFFRKS